MPILKIYIKMHSRSFFFSHQKKKKKKKKNMSLRHVESVVNRSFILLTNVLSVTAYNTLTTKPIVKKICWKNNAIFYLKYRFSYSMRHNDASKATPHPFPYASFPEFRQNR